jgi:hypothetical protein
MPRFAFPSWRWMSVQRHALPRHLDRVDVTQLMRREAAPHSRLRSGAPQLLSHTHRRQRPPAGASVNNPEQRPDRHLDAVVKPRTEQLPSPLVRADLATLSALVVTHQDRAAIRVEVALRQRERLADAKPGTPTSRRSARVSAGRACGRRRGASRARSPRQSEDRRDSAYPCWEAPELAGGPATWPPTGGDQQHPTTRPAPDPS